MQKNLKKHMLENGQTFFRKSEDGRKLRLAIWETQRTKSSGTVFFLNGHREFIEKYSETYEFFIEKGLTLRHLIGEAGPVRKAIPLTENSAYFKYL